MSGNIILSHMCTRNEDHIWFQEYKVRQTEFSVILAHFLPFNPPDGSENKKFEKTKKIPGDVIILHKCVKNHNHATLFLRYNM